MCCNKKNVFNIKCADYNYDKSISFKNGKCYHNEIYFGDIVSIDNKIIKVCCKNGNRYMENQIIEYMYNSNKND